MSEIRVCSAPPAKLTNVFPEHDFAYIGVPKCGTQTMRKAFWPDMDSYPCVPIEDALQVSVRMTVIRHPLDRIFSAWNHIWPDHDFGVWWEHVKKNPKWDIHTFPYSDWLGGIPTEVYRLEVWDEWWPEMVDRFPGLFPEVMPWRNYSPRTFDLGDYKEFHEDILSVYEDDLDLYRSLC